LKKKLLNTKQLYKVGLFTPPKSSFHVHVKMWL